MGLLSLDQAWARCRNLSAHCVIGALAFLPEPFGATRIVGADARPLRDGAPNLFAVAEGSAHLPGGGTILCRGLEVADHRIQARNHPAAVGKIGPLNLRERGRRR